MKLAITMDEAIELEERIQTCYGLLSKVTQDGAAQELRQLAREERSHVSVLRTGKNFVVRAPDVFGGEAVPDTELRSGIRAASDLEEGLKTQKLGYPRALKMICYLEKKCERIHISAAVEFKDYSLKKLFEALARADAEHRQRVERLIARL